MAKYSRYDPRNKNKGRNKTRSLEKDVRIRDAEDYNDADQAACSRANWTITNDKKEDVEVS